MENYLKNMYKLLKMLNWLIKFKKEKKDFELAADFHALFQPEGDERDKAVGAAKMKAEEAVTKQVIMKKLLKEYVRGTKRKENLSDTNS